MEIIASYYTDVGSVKEINQDSLSVKVVNSPRGKIVFALVCDGMGGLEQGELASKEVVVAFNNWFATQFAQMVTENTFTQQSVDDQWQDLIETLNSRLSEYADNQGMMMGTTLSALLIYKGDYFICHVGDSRIYHITQSVNRITQDHTLVAKEIEMGVLTEEEALVDPRRSILLQCVGASGVVEPQYERGTITGETTFLLASDGFIHMISEEEIYQYFRPEVLTDKDKITDICEKTTCLVKERGERDNITVIAVVVK